MSAYVLAPNKPLIFSENLHGNAVLERLRVQKDAGKFCDVTLYVEGKQFRAHRNVLASCSPYFNSILKMQRIVKEHLTITCKNSEVFQCLLNYMYTGSVVIDRENVSELVRLSNHFLVSNLKNYCSEYLERFMEVSNCVSARELAEKYNMTSLLKRSTEFIKLNIIEVMKQEELLDSSITLVEGFLSDDAFTIPQTEILPFVTSWVRRDIAGREQHTRTLMTFVDWTAMDQKAITEHIDRDGLYPRSEVALFAVLQALHSNNLLYNKYQNKYEALHNKINQTNGPTSNSVSELSNSTREGRPSKNVKMEVPSPSVSETPQSPKAKMSSNSNLVKTVSQRRLVEGSLEDDVAEVEMSFSADDSSDEEQNRLLKEEIEDPDFEVEDEGFVKDEPALDIKEEDPDIANSFEGTNDDEGNDDEEDEVEECGEVDDISNSKESDTSLSKQRETRRLTRNARNNSRQLILNKSKQVSKASARIAALKGMAGGGSGSRRGRPPGSGKKQLEAAAKQAIEVNAINIEKEEQVAVKKLKCKQCKFRACNDAELDKHVDETHQGSHDVVYKCSICDFSCGYIKEYYRHLKKHFPGPPFKCDNCEYTCDKMVNLVAHRSKTCDDKPHHCTMCDYKCRSRPYLLVHMRSHTGELPYKCETCGRAYAMRSTLEQHLTSHSKEQPYLCDTCGFATKYIAHLMAHKRIHTGDVHRCTFPECKYSTPKKSQLISHSRTHEGVRPHTCHICGRGFLEKSHLVRHERIHLDDKPFKCDQCDYASSRRDKLKEHINRHHGDNASARVPYKARGARSGSGGDQRKSNQDMAGDDFMIDNGSSSQSSNHGMNLTAPDPLGVAGTATGEMADLLIAQSMTVQQLKYPTALSSATTSGGGAPGHPHSVNVDYHHQPQSILPNTRLTLAVPSNGDAIHSEPRQLSSLPVLHTTSASNHHMMGNMRNNPSAAALAAMLLDQMDNKNSYHHHQPAIGYSSTTLQQLPNQASGLSSSQTIQSSNDYTNMSPLF